VSLNTQTGIFSVIVSSDSNPEVAKPDWIASSLRFSQ